MSDPCQLPCQKPSICSRPIAADSFAPRSCHSPAGPQPIDVIHKIDFEVGEGSAFVGMRQAAPALNGQEASSDEIHIGSCDKLRSSARHGDGLPAP